MNGNPLMNKPYIGQSPAKAPMTPAEVAALMLKQKEENALAPKDSLPGVNTAPGLFGAGGAGLTAAGIGAGAVTGALQGTGALNAIKNKPLNVGQQAALALPTFGASLAINPLQKLFGSGKSADQQRRDQMRGDLQERGVLDEGYNVTNADQSKYDIGKDGGDPRYNVDFSREGIGDVVGALNPLAALDAHGDKQLTSDFAGYQTNAALSSGNWQDNVKGYFEQRGLDRDKAYTGVLQLFAEEAIDAPTRDAYLASIDKTFGVGPSGVAGSGGSGGVRQAPRPRQASNEPQAPVAVPQAAPVVPTPAAVAPLPPQPAPQSEEDYIKAILAVQAANAPKPAASTNPLSRRLY